MSFSPKLSLSAALMVSVAGSPALADLTVDDAWNAWKLQIGALGLTVTAEETRDGDALQIGSIALSGDLPMQAGSVSIGFPGPRFEPDGDGAISVILPNDGQLSIGGEISGEGSMRAVMEWNTSDFRWVMSGTPDRVVSNNEYASSKMELVGVTLNGEAVPKASGALTVLNGTYENTSVFKGGMVTSEGSTTYGSQDVEYAFEFEDGDSVFGMSSKGYAENLDMTHAIALPLDGLNLMGLHTHLREGVKMAFSGTVGKYSTVDETTMDGRVLTMQKSDAVDYETTASLDERGIMFLGKAGAYTGSGQMAELPFPISLAGSSVAVKMAFPLLSSDEPQDVTMMMDLRDLTVNDEIWAMVDPGTQLPRDPMTLSFDLSGQALVTHDLLDIAALSALGPGETPIMPVSATLKDLLFSAVGTELTANGAFTFDGDDMETFPGMPRPEGTLNLRVVGVNALIDRLIAMGLMPEDQAMGARMMMNMILVPGEGEDTLKSNIEINSEGHLLANGQRLK